MRTLSPLIAVAALFLAGTAGAARPRVVVNSDGASSFGLPAISADGSTIALPEADSDLSGASSFAVRFRRVSDGATLREAPISSIDELGQPRRLPTRDGHTAWARARTVNAELARGNYRSLVELTRSTEDDARWDGGGLRARHDVRNGRLAVIGARGVMQTRLERQRVVCGMELESLDQVVFRPAEVIALYGDAATGVTLLGYGLRYASCMCKDDVDYRIGRLAR